MADRTTLEQFVLGVGLAERPWACGFAVAGGHRELDRALNVDRDEAEAVIAWTIEQRLDGLAWAALADHLSGVDEQYAALADAHMAGLRSTVAAEAAAVWSLGVLADVGVSGWLLKGLASAHLDYDDPSLRTSYDADLLVRRADLGAAVDALVRAGCRRVAPPVRPAWERRYARAVELVSPDGVEIDLHAAIVDGYFGVALDHDRLRCDSGAIELGGRSCPVLSPTGRLVATSYALVLSRGPKARFLRDIAQLLTTCEVDIEEARSIAGNGSVVVDEALRRVGAAFGITLVESRQAVAGPSTDEMVRAMSATSWSSDARGALAAMKGWDRVRYASGVAWPTRRHLRSRQLTRLGHGRRLGDQVRLSISERRRAVPDC